MSSERDRYERAYAAFEEARLGPRGEREAILTRCCGDDAALRREVEELLRAHDSDRPDAFSERAVEAARDALRGLGRRRATGLAAWGSGATIGACRLVRRLHSEADGASWLAESGPRRVTVELAAADHARAHPGFEQAAEVLRGLEHPNLTRVEDAGLTSNGCPYLVTELCLGTPLLGHVEERELPLAGRASLFLAVGEAACALEAAGLSHPRLSAAAVTVTSPASRPVPRLSGLVFARPLEDRREASAVGSLARLLQELLDAAPRCAPPAALARYLPSGSATEDHRAAPAAWLEGVRSALDEGAPRRLGVLGRLRGLLPGEPRT